MGGFAGLALSSLVSEAGYRRSPESETMMEPAIAPPGFVRRGVGRRCTWRLSQLNAVLSFTMKGGTMRLAVVAATGFILLIALDCPGASKITSWETGKVLDADRKQELVGAAEHSSTFGAASRSTTSALYNAYEEYAIESDAFIYLTREHLRSDRSKPALLTINGTVKFHVDGRKLVILDNEGKEHETIIVKQASKAQNADSRPSPDAALSRVGASPVEADGPLDNDAIVRMVVGGLKEDTVVRVIEARSGKYVLVPDALLALKAAGVPQGVVAAMCAKMNASR
jgi:hypothetical protein